MKLTWIPVKVLPDPSKITSVHGLCFEKGKMVVVHVKGRGFNNPGGHIEKGETPEEAFHREAYEEASVRGNIQLVGMIEVSHEENPLYDQNGKYPLIGYQLYYRMDIIECLPFQREHETTCRIWVEPEEYPYIIDDHELSLLALKEALRMKN
ncbi:NUDIX hydrolase [Bacillus salitolerans]|uniref:NUDIX hydrolase n=1 Tax=Bacillus salitolerans TaxID=1437434 RepID=A0ABW4LTB8_9BACI